MTQRELSEALGISHTQVARYERGTAMPRPGVLVKMAKVLATPLEHLRDGANIQVIDFYGPDGEKFASISLSDDEYSGIDQASRLSGVPVEDIIKNIMFKGMGMKEPLPTSKPPGRRLVRKARGEELVASDNGQVEFANDPFYALESAKSALIDSLEKQLKALSDQANKMLTYANEAGQGSEEHQRVMAELSELSQLITYVRTELDQLTSNDGVPPTAGKNKKAK